MLTLPSGVYLAIRAEFPGRVRASLRWANKNLLGCAPVERGRGDLGPNLCHEHERVFLADAVRDPGIVERLLLPEHRHPSLMLTPRTHDSHGHLPFRKALKPPSPASPIRHNQDFPHRQGRKIPSRARKKAACARPCEALLIGGSSTDPRKAMGKLDGKVAVVTGASRGIGAEIARLFAAEGGRVI